MLVFDFLYTNRWSGSANHILDIQYREKTIRQMHENIDVLINICLFDVLNTRANRFSRTTFDRNVVLVEITNDT